MPSTCVRAGRRRRIRRCCSSTATPATARTGRRSWATSRRVFPWRRSTAAARAAAPKTSAWIKGTTLRGHIIRGLEDSPENLLFRSIFLDTAAVGAESSWACRRWTRRRVGATGGSQGGGLTLACAALEPRINRAAPAYPFLCDYRRVWEMDLALNAYEELRWFFRSFDPRHEREEEIFTRLGYIDLQNLARASAARC